LIHKSTLIKQALRNLTLSKREFEQRADIDYNLFKKILRGKAKIDTDTIIFYNYNGPGYYDLSGGKEICEYSGNNVYVDTELVGTFVNYYAFQMGSVNYFMKGETK